MVQESQVSYLAGLAVLQTGENMDDKELQDFFHTCRRDARNRVENQEILGGVYAILDLMQKRKGPTVAAEVVNAILEKFLKVPEPADLGDLPHFKDILYLLEFDVRIMGKNDIYRECRGVSPAVLAGYERLIALREK